MENKTNTGAIFKNDKKTSDKHPDYRGKEMEVALWVKQGKNGSFFSAAFSEPYVAPERAITGDSIDDDLPF